MSCCNHSPVTIVWPPCPTDCPDTNAITAQNDNLAGYGVLESFTDNNLSFRGISNTDGYITVNIDAPTKTILLGLDPALVNGSLPDATESIKGKIALASAAEAQAQLNDEKAITPLKLGLVTATVARRGLVELATSIETQTGVDNTRAVTPEGLNFTLADYKQTNVFADAAARNITNPAFAGQLGIQQNTGVVYYSTGTGTGDWESGNLDSPTISSTVNFVNPVWKLNGVEIPVDSVVVTGSTLGVPISRPISDFLTNSSSGQIYTLTDTSLSRILDAATATTEDVANVLITLIVDLASMQRPILP